jgi:hypothetical protein
MRAKSNRRKGSKTVKSDGTSVTAVSAAEHKSLDKQIKETQEKLRKRYPEIHGKKVDWISHRYDDGYLFFNVRFTDGKNFAILCSPMIVTDIVDFSDLKTGNDVIIREYYKRRNRDGH